jgi:hypothetical protein
MTISRSLFGDFKTFELERRENNLCEIIKPLTAKSLNPMSRKLSSWWNFEIEGRKWLSIATES